MVKTFSTWPLLNKYDIYKKIEVGLQTPPSLQTPYNLHSLWERPKIENLNFVFAWSKCIQSNLKGVIITFKQTLDVIYKPHSLNVKRVKKRVNANSLEKEWKPLKKSCYPLEKERKEKKKWDFSLEKEWKKSEKRVKVNTSEHHSKMYCPPFKSLKSGHSLAESELHSFSSE